MTSARLEAYTRAMRKLSLALVALALAACAPEAPTLDAGPDGCAMLCRPPTVCRVIREGQEADAATHEECRDETPHDSGPGCVPACRADEWCAPSPVPGRYNACCPADAGALSARCRAP